MTFLDPNAPCFCGVGKKLKFCCKDILSDLDKIARALEGKQYEAANRLLERAFELHPDRASLWVLKLDVLLQKDDAPAAVHEFAQQFIAIAPHNPNALALCAIVDLAIDGGHDVSDEARQQILVEAAAKLHLALEYSQESVSARVMDALTALGQLLLQAEFIIPGLEHLRLQLALLGSANPGTQMLVAMTRAPEIPLLMKQPLPIPPPADWVKWKDEYLAIRRVALLGGWTQAAARIEAILDEHEPHATLLRAHAALCCKLPDRARAAASLRRMAEHCDVSADDAAEAWALAMLLEPFHFGSVDTVQLTFPATNTSVLLERLQSNRKIRFIAGDLTKFVDEGSPPPKSAFVLLDRDMPFVNDDLRSADIPLRLGVGLLFGRETDREARLEVKVNRGDLESVLNAIQEIGKETLGSDWTDEVIDQVPATLQLMAIEPAFPHDLPRKMFDALSDTLVRDFVLDVMPTLPHPAFDGKSLQEVATEPAYRRRLMGFVLSLEANFRSHRNIVADLWNQLKLPTRSLGKAKLTDLTSVPLVRLHLVDPTTISDDALLTGFHWAYQNAATAAAYRFGKELVKRDIASRSEIYGKMAQIASDSDESIDLIVEAQRAAKEEGTSPGLWMVGEFQLRAIRGESAAAQRLLMEIQSRYLNEPIVAQALMRALESLGLVDPQGQVKTNELEEAQPVASSGASSLWTPDSQAATAAGASEEGRSKLWVPGMD